MFGLGKKKRGRKKQGFFARRASTTNSSAKRRGAKGKVTGGGLSSLWSSQGGKCAKSGKRMRKTKKKGFLATCFGEVDHERSIKRGGRNTNGNVQWLCRSENRKKGG